MTSAVAELITRKLPTAIVSKFGSFGLEMTEGGWTQARLQCPRTSGVYIHVTTDGIPLRVGIGVGAEGIYGRWFHSRSCHRFSFLQHPRQPSNYTSFFRQIAQRYQQTEVLYIVTGPDDAPKIEGLLCETLVPVWEVKNHEERYVWRNKNSFVTYLPTLEESILLRLGQVEASWRRL